MRDACSPRHSGAIAAFAAAAAGQNDDAQTAARLAKRLQGLKCHVNLIPLNPTRGFDGRPTALPQADDFVSVLQRRGIPATVRVRRGIDIDAGCGQLADAASKDRVIKKSAERVAGMVGKRRERVTRASEAAAAISAFTPSSPIGLR